MIPNEINIDTLALQIDFDNSVKQRNKLELIKLFIYSRRLGQLKEVKTNQNMIKYELLYANSKILSLHSGSARSRDKITGRNKNFYYIRIRFAGLKSHNLSFDKASYASLATICALLNTSGTNYRFCELDIALDVFCPFDNMLAMCTKKSANVSYNLINFKQYFSGSPTTYIEDYSDLGKKKNAVLRSYLYDKSAKNKLPFSVTRFEIKLQNRFFIKNSFDISSIRSAFDRYCVMYFSDIYQKQVVINKYNRKELGLLEFNKFRIYPDFQKVQKLLNEIRGAFVNYNGKIIIPKFENFF